MTHDIHNHHKALLKPLRDALYNYDAVTVKATLSTVLKSRCARWIFGELKMG